MVFDVFQQLVIQPWVLPAQILHVVFYWKLQRFLIEMLQVFGNIRRHHLRVLYCIFQVLAMRWTALEDPCQRHFLDSAADVLQNNYKPQVREHPCKP